MEPFMIQNIAKENTEPVSSLPGQDDFLNRAFGYKIENKPEKTDTFMNEVERRQRSRKRQQTYFELRAEKQRRVKKYYKKLREREQLKAKKEQELLQKEIYQKGIAQLKQIRGEGEDRHDIKAPRSSYILDKSSLLKILNGGL